MGSNDASASFCADFIAGLADLGVDLVLVSPGSRNTPIALAVAADDRIRDINIRDERSAGFMALGYSKATDRPAAVVCTSGSAAAHYLPAVVEASRSATPLIVVTADRPRRLRSTFAHQTMNQVDLYGRFAKAFTDVVDTTDPRLLGHGAVLDALSAVPGAVHINVPLDEPLVPDGAIVPSEAMPGRPPPSTYSGPTDTLGRLPGRRVIIVASGRQPRAFADALDATARSLGAAVVADTQTPAQGPSVLHNADLLFDGLSSLSGGWPDELVPDVVVRLGPLPTSKPIWQWLETTSTPQILVHDGPLDDPLSTADRIDADPTGFLLANEAPHPSPVEFADAWSRLDALVGAAAAEALELLPFPNEPEIARSVTRHVPDQSVLYVASSMPIRDVDVFGVRRHGVRVLSNRGVNGIDGTISSAIGAALAGQAVTLLIGDIAALHDATAMAEAVALDVRLRVIVVNNDGGGIFSFLPQATSDVIDEDVFERHWGTPHGLSLRTVATALGMASRRIDDREALQAAVGAPIDGPELLEIETDRHRNVTDHATVRSAVRSALGGSHEIEDRA